MSDGNYYDPKPDLFWRNRYDAAVKLSYEVEADLGRAKKRIAELETELAAAEERGRRRGVEERDELRAALSRLLEALCIADSDVRTREVRAAVANGQAALAPRDSGKEGT